MIWTRLVDSILNINNHYIKHDIYELSLSKTILFLRIYSLVSKEHCNLKFFQIQWTNGKSLLNLYKNLVYRYFILFFYVRQNILI